MSVEERLRHFFASSTAMQGPRVVVVDDSSASFSSFSSSASSASPSSSSSVRLGAGNWTLPQLLVLVQSKITERTAHATLELQDAYKLFGRPANGITPSHFRKQLKKWGIQLSSEETLLFLDYLGVKNTNAITFSELVERMLPKDYTRKSWNVVADEAAEQKRQQPMITAVLLQSLKKQQQTQHKIKIPERILECVTDDKVTRPVHQVEFLILSQLLKLSSSTKEDRLMCLYELLLGKPKPLVPLPMALAPSETSLLQNQALDVTQWYARLMKKKIFMSKKEFDQVFVKIPKKSELSYHTFVILLLP
jgi:hypothetical protein